ncbi:glycosyl hydrolases family 18-domain-containing protein [Jimgerdemannia flammicorona]|uniref:Glycosyl hydrolases family 18-domain-containing protein n=1 Tax=Jimgerdemannia flammicorona TaxID=994334 RepID=A0A433QU30_9FUNG|nr:glycosyl hydrolases family 18-domain-containing protein [Jimgerdemannia flammicorona]
MVYVTSNIQYYFCFVTVAHKDFFGPYGTNGVVEVNSPLLPLSGGANPSLPLYGHTYTLTNPSETNDVGSAWNASGTAGNCSQSSGVLFYYEIANLIASKKLTPVFTPEGYSYYGTYVDSKGATNWVGYDDRLSLLLKTQFAAQNGLLGVVHWSINQDLAGAANHNPIATGQPNLSEFLSFEATHLCPAATIDGISLPVAVENFSLYPKCAKNNALVQPYTCSGGKWVKASKCSAPVAGSFADASPLQVK